MADDFGEAWFSEESQVALAGLYRLTDDLDGLVVEVGCWTGRSTCALANACYPVEVQAVDTWNGSPGEESEQLARQRDVFAQFQANVRAHTAGNVQTWRMDWREFFALDLPPIKFLHIDATHTYEEVRDNIEAALPLIEPGGVICGDDQHHPPVRRAVLDTLGNAGLTWTLWWRRL